jgi:hypothetical protein
MIWTTVEEEELYYRKGYKGAGVQHVSWVYMIDD